jgi:hypothetical protein
MADKQKYIQSIDVHKDPLIRVGSNHFENLAPLVDAFAWLIREDKKQNPELYKLTK